jgi:hypothetical protein
VVLFTLKSVVLNGHPAFIPCLFSKEHVIPGVAESHFMAKRETSWLSGINYVGGREEGGENLAKSASTEACLLLEECWQFNILAVIVGKVLPHCLDPFQFGCLMLIFLLEI